MSSLMTSFSSEGSGLGIPCECESECESERVSLGQATSLRGTRFLARTLVSSMALKTSLLTFALSSFSVPRLSRASLSAALGREERVGSVFGQSREESRKEIHLAQQGSGFRAIASESSSIRTVFELVQRRHGEALVWGDGGARPPFERERLSNTGLGYLVCRILQRRRQTEETECEGGAKPLVASRAKRSRRGENLLRLRKLVLQARIRSILMCPA